MTETPQLPLFPAEIWPAKTDLTALQAQLQCLFRTDFTRNTWNVSQQQTEVEIAFDQGCISANGQSEPICEVEFELKHGQADYLLQLAWQLAQQLPLRLGKASKAQRGYRLAGQQAYQGPADVSCETVAQLLAAWQTLEEAIELVAEPELCVQYWQQLSEVLSHIPRLLQQQALQDNIANLTLWLLGELQHPVDDVPKALMQLQAQRQYGLLQLVLLQQVLIENN